MSRRTSTRARADPDAVPAARRTQAHRRAGRRRDHADHEAAGTLIKALARAWRWQGMLDEGVHATVGEIGDAENISKSYVGRILRLALLAPDTVEDIVAGKADQGVVLEQVERPVPANWNEQRARFSNLGCRG